MKLQFAVLVALASCGKAGKSGVVLTFHPVGSVGGKLHFSMAGAKEGALGLELPALPAKGAPIEISSETLCGHGPSITKPFPDPQDANRVHQDKIESGPYAGIDEVSVEISDLSGLPDPPATEILIDPKVTDEVRAGAQTLKNRQVVFDLGCVKQLSIGATKLDLPAPNSDGRRAVVLVSASPDTCYRDEVAAYGDARGGAVNVLKGARLYTLSFGSYQDVFEQPSAKETAAVGASGTTRNAIYAVPCP
ncbi:MAG TPA: hypothetical protein VGL61_22440 [Kofleriaceae bacterium]|jgi:hypothetical protein